MTIKELKEQLELFNDELNVCDAFYEPITVVESGMDHERSETVVKIY